MLGLALYTVLAKKLGTARIRGVARVFGYTTVMSIGLGAVGMHRAKADLGKKSIEIGENFSSLGNLLGDAHDFNLNGQTIHTSFAQTLEGKKAVLDKFEKACKEAEGGDAPVWNSIPESRGQVPTSTLTTMPMLRNEDGNKGVLICVVPAKNSSQRSIGDAWKAFVGTGNLNEIGKLRYAYVTEGVTGTSVLTIWTDGDFSFNALMAKPGEDTPGSDPIAMMRPDRANRIVNASVADLPYRVFAYQTQDSPEKVLESYDAKMGAAGWTSIGNPILEASPHEGNVAHAYIRNGVQGYMTATTGPDHNTLVGIAEAAGLPKEFNRSAAPLRDSDGF